MKNPYFCNASYYFNSRYDDKLIAYFWHQAMHENYSRSRIMEASLIPNFECTISIDDFKIRKDINAKYGYEVGTYSYIFDTNIIPIRDRYKFIRAYNKLYDMSISLMDIFKDTNHIFSYKILCEFGKYSILDISFVITKYNKTIMFISKDILSDETISDYIIDNVFINLWYEEYASVYKVTTKTIGTSGNKSQITIPRSSLMRSGIIESNSWDLYVPMGRTSKLYYVTPAVCSGISQSNISFTYSKIFNDKSVISSVSDIYIINRPHRTNIITHQASDETLPIISTNYSEYTTSIKNIRVYDYNRDMEVHAGRVPSDIYSEFAFPDLYNFSNSLSYSEVIVTTLANIEFGDDANFIVTKDNKFVYISSTKDGKSKLSYFSIDNNLTLWTNEYDYEFTCNTLTYDEKYLYVGCSDGTLLKIEASLGLVLWVVSYNKHCINDVCVNKVNFSVFTARSTGEINSYTTDKGAMEWTNIINSVTNDAYKLEISNDDTTLFCGRVGPDPMTQTYFSSHLASTGDPILTTVFVTGSGGLYNFVLSSDSTKLYTGNYLGELLCYDTSNFTITWRNSSCLSMINSIDMTLDKKFILVGKQNGHLDKYDAETGAIISELVNEPQYPVIKSMMDSNGKYNYIIDSQGDIKRIVVHEGNHNSIYIELYEYNQSHINYIYDNHAIEFMNNLTGRTEYNTLVGNNKILSIKDYNPIIPEYGHYDFIDSDYKGDIRGYMLDKLLSLANSDPYIYVKLYNFIDNFEIHTINKSFKAKNIKENTNYILRYLTETKMGGNLTYINGKYQLPVKRMLVSESIDSSSGKIYTQEVVWTNTNNDDVLDLLLIDDDIYTADKIGTVRKLSSETGKLEWTYKVPVGYPYSVATDIYGDNLYIASSDNNVYIVDVDTRKDESVYRTAVNRTYALCIDDYYTYKYVSGEADDDCSISKIRVKDSRRLWQKTYSSKPTYSLIIDSSNTILYSGGEDGIVRKLNAGDGSLIWESPIGQNIWKVALSSNEKYVFVASTDHKLYKLRASNGKILWSFEAHSDEINEVVPDQYNQYIYTASSDNTVKKIKEKIIYDKIYHPNTVISEYENVHNGDDITADIYNKSTSSIDYMLSDDIKFTMKNDYQFIFSDVDLDTIKIEDLMFIDSITGEIYDKSNFEFIITANKYKYKDPATSEYREVIATQRDIIYLLTSLQEMYATKDTIPIILKESGVEISSDDISDIPTYADGDLSHKDINLKDLSIKLKNDDLMNRRITVTNGGSLTSTTVIDAENLSKTNSILIPLNGSSINPNKYELYINGRLLSKDEYTLVMPTNANGNITLKITNLGAGSNDPNISSKINPLDSIVLVHTPIDYDTIEFDWHSDNNYNSNFLTDSYNKNLTWGDNTSYTTFVKYDDNINFKFARIFVDGYRVPVEQPYIHKTSNILHYIKETVQTTILKRFDGLYTPKRIIIKSPIRDFDIYDTKIGALENDLLNEFCK